jgi:hypothetical protein
MFYAGESKQPVELVINSIGKNHIHSYVSTAKYKEAELQVVSRKQRTRGAGAAEARAIQQRYESEIKGAACGNRTQPGFLVENPKDGPRHVRKRQVKTVFRDPLTRGTINSGCCPSAAFQQLEL